MSSQGDMTLFAFGDEVFRFRTSPHLLRYCDVVEWDQGYLVVNAQYDTLGTVEEYIDLRTVCRHLMRDPEQCLAPIQEVVIEYA